MTERDERLLANLGAAVDRHGECVTPHHVEMPAQVLAVFDGLRERGFNPVLVRGSVRDSFDGRPPKDLDIEVYGGSVDDVAEAASKFGQVNKVGKAFGVLKMTLPDGNDLDLSVPRRDNKTGAGHRGFSVDADPTMTVSEAATRRDFTVNAISYDPHLGVLIDPHGGKDDLDSKTLRHVSPAFDEDPLRVLRGVQFAARYDMTMAPETADRCRSLADEMKDLPDERVRGEFGKLYSKGGSPSAGLGVLRQTGWDRNFPGLAALNGHRTSTATDRARSLMDRRGVPREEQCSIIAAVIAFRMSDADAKAFTQKTVEGGDAQRRAYALSRSRLPEASPESVRAAAQEKGGSLRERLLVAMSVGDEDEVRHAEQVEEIANREQVLDGPEPDLLNGKDILARGNGKPGPWVGSVGRGGSGRAGVRGVS